MCNNRLSLTYFHYWFICWLLLLFLKPLFAPTYNVPWHLAFKKHWDWSSHWDYNGSSWKVKWEQWVFQIRDQEKPYLKQRTELLWESLSLKTVCKRSHLTGSKQTDGHPGSSQSDWHQDRGGVGGLHGGDWHPGLLQPPKHCQAARRFLLWEQTVGELREEGGTWTWCSSLLLKNWQSTCF